MLGLDLVHCLADEGERISELIDRPQIPFHFADGVENLIVQPVRRRAQFNNLSHGPPTSSK